MNPNDRRAARQAFERKARRRSLLIATLSTVLVLGSLAILIPMTPGWPAVRESFFNTQILAETMPTLFSAFLLDIAISCGVHRPLRFWDC